MLYWYFFKYIHTLKSFYLCSIIDVCVVITQFDQYTSLNLPWILSYKVPVL